MTAADKIVPLREQITGVTGELNDMANTMGENVKGAIAGLSSAWESLALSFSNSKGWMKDVVDWLANRIRSIANSIQDVDDRISDISNTSSRQGEETYNTQLIELRTSYNNRVKKLMEEGETQEEASLKAIREISYQRVSVTQTELDKLEDLKNKIKKQVKNMIKSLDFHGKSF